jgi:putative mycofactocin binding protein MftB
MLSPRIDLGRAWELDEQVALRPEPFGALAYNFGTRRLTFLKTRTLLDVVRRLDQHPTAHDACVSAGVRADELTSYAQALAVLADTGMIRAREQA